MKLINHHQHPRGVSKGTKRIPSRISEPTGRALSMCARILMPIYKKSML